nr:inner membrane protein YbjM [uncultured Enterobacter sp.]
MKYKRGWAGAFCCFLLFIVVCLSLLLKMKGAFRDSGHPELGLLFFIIPGAVASFVSRSQKMLLPLMGAMLAAPVCFVLMRVWLTPTRSFWQELAWLFSAVFWCALGALCYLLVSHLLSKRRRE